MFVRGREKKDRGGQEENEKKKKTTDYLRRFSKLSNCRKTFLTLTLSTFAEASQKCFVKRTHHTRREDEKNCCAKQID